jgi:hypothetical protein
VQHYEYLPPRHCTELVLRNFRGFRQTQPVRLAPLTFLVGPNSSGKSSFADSLMLVAQSNFGPRNLSSPVPNWGGSLVDLGSYLDTVYQHKVAQTFGITLVFDSSFLSEPWFGRRSKPKKVRPIVRVTFTLSSGLDRLGHLRTIRFEDIMSGLTAELVFRSQDVLLRLAGKENRWSPEPTTVRSDYAGFEWLRRQLSKRPRATRGHLSNTAWLRLTRFMLSYTMTWFLSQSQRVTSGRAGPRRWYPVTSAQTTSQRQPIQGVFESVEPSAFGGSRPRQPVQPDKTRPTLAAVLADLEIANEIHDTRLSAYHSAIYVSDSVTNVTSNLIDVGYGASQVIPVIQACLSSPIGPLVIEQPELHLHPRAQGRLADLICDTSRRRQVIVETHSVHFINHARILVASGILPPEHVIIHYIYRTKSGSRVHTIPLATNGEFLASWPEGFFDERYNDTMKLLAITSTAK